MLLFVASRKFSIWFPDGNLKGPSPLEEESLDGI
jgi:hypothetical protein